MTKYTIFLSEGIGQQVNILDEEGLLTYPSIDEMIELDIVDAYEIEMDDKDKDKILPQVEFTILSEGFDYLPIFFDEHKIKYKRDK
jgi:hypothetical protein